jgi:flagellar biosynthesis/type III secretory pathway M-ring protein FliF/YscJ
VSWLRRAWRWVVVAIVLALPVFGWLSERRRRQSEARRWEYQVKAAERRAVVAERIRQRERVANERKTEVIATAEAEAQALEAKAEDRVRGEHDLEAIAAELDRTRR